MNDLHEDKQGKREQSEENPTEDLGLVYGLRWELHHAETLAKRYRRGMLGSVVVCVALLVAAVIGWTR